MKQPQTAKNLPERSCLQRDEPMVYTGGQILPDGSTLELIRDPKGELKLLRLKERSAEIAEPFVRDGKPLAPPGLDPVLLHAIQLPSGTAYASPSELFNQIAHLVMQVTQAGDNFVSTMAFLVIATWMADYLPAPLFVWIVASSAAPLVQLLSLLCRHALVVSDISSATFHPRVMDLQPTLITEAFPLSKRALNLLRASTRHGTLLANGVRAVDPFCSKFIIAPEAPRDRAMVGFPLELVLPPTPEYIPLMSTLEAQRIATEYQNKLLGYRAMNRTKVRAPALDVDQFSEPMRQVAYCLAASIVNDVELQSRIVPLLRPLDGEIRVDRASELRAIVIQVLLAQTCSLSNTDYPVMEITRDVNTVLWGRGDTLGVSPEKVGWALRSLGLYTNFLTGGRKGLSLLNGMREKIRDLATAHGVTLRETPIQSDCTLCQAPAQDTASTS